MVLKNFPNSLHINNYYLVIEFNLIKFYLNSIYMKCGTGFDIFQLRFISVCYLIIYLYIK